MSTTPIRPRRLRIPPLLRAMVRETRVHAEQLVMPHFVLPERTGTEDIASMPGIKRLGIDPLITTVGRDRELGILSVLLFGIAPNQAKDATGSHSADPGSAVARAVAAVKKHFGDEVLVATDVCLCAYTSHGHCGVLEDARSTTPHNDRTLPLLANMALTHARAGADIVAPSDMMDGRVAAIRCALDAQQFENVAILSYAVKYASGYYGPFRDAAGSQPGNGDRSTYQMDCCNAREAEREALLDEQEGADLLMVKPALAYLDVIQRVRQVTRLPLAAYNVSGEYAQVKAAAERGWIDEARVVRENLTAMVRAGADLVITYHAREALERHWLTP